MPQDSDRSERLRRIIDTPPGFWVGRGISLVVVIFLLLFILAATVPISHLGGATFLEYLT